MNIQPSTTEIAAMAARTKIAKLETGAMRFTRKHKGETNAVNAAHNTTAARVMVQATSHPAYVDLLKVHAAAYQEHKNLTVASGENGMRFLPAGREFQHAERMRVFADQHAALVAKFMADYPAERAAAPARLNGLFDPAMWPEPEYVNRRFKFATRYLPTPTDGSWSDWFVEAARIGQGELSDRLAAALVRVRDNCKGDGKLFATVFDNIRELVDLVPDLDVTGSFAPVVAAMAPLAALHADSLRDDETGRQAASQTAASILSVLGGVK